MMPTTTNIRLLLLLVMALCSDAQASNKMGFQNPSNLREDIAIRENDGTFGILYEFKVNKDVEYTYVFTNVSQMLLGRTARIVVETENASRNNPVLIVVRQKRHVTAWQHPLIVNPRMSESSEYQKVSRTICPTKYYMTNSSGNIEDDEETLLVTASTSSPNNVSVKLSAEIVKDFYLSLLEERKIKVSPSEPSFYGFLYPNDTETILLRAHSEDTFCTTISIQYIDCPVYDLENTVKFEGQWETMMYKGGMAIKKEEYQTGFYVVFVANSKDDECIQKEDTKIRMFQNRSTIISFQLVPEIYKNLGYMWAILTPIILCLIIYALCGVVIFLKHRKTPSSENVEVDVNTAQEDLKNDNQSYQQNPSTLEGNGSNDLDEVVATDAVLSSNDPFLCNSTEIQSYEQNPSTLKGNGSNDVDEVVTTDAVLSSNDAFGVSRKKSHLYLWIITLAGIFYFIPAKERSYLGKKSHLYLWITILAGIFFFVPAIQRVYTHQTILQETGDYDLCYYNYHCAHPSELLNLIDFNHVYSNIAYILLGILFIIITKIEKTFYSKQISMKKYSDLPQEFGLYYAMGVSLIAEGLLSGTYHICPRGSNFQFDTTFMYVTALLCIVNIYQNLDQRRYADATVIFLFLGVVTFLAMLGNIVSPFILSIIIGLGQVIVSLEITLQLYYKEKISAGWMGFREVIQRCCGWRVEDSNSGESPKESTVQKTLTLILVNLINWIIATLGIMGYLGGLSNILLAVFIGNLIIPFLFNIYIKYEQMINRERAKKGEASTMLLQGAMSDVVNASPTQTINTSSDARVSEDNNDTNQTGGRTQDIIVSNQENCFKSICSIIFRKLSEQNFYIITTISFWAPALYFFSSSTSSWEESPAMSRNKNQPCIWLQFYDNHDIWHFLSAGALFFSLMVLLSMNNHRIDTSQNKDANVQKQK